MSDQHDTVVVKDGGSSTGVILGIIALVIILAAGWYFLLGPGAGSGSDTTTPSDINVDVNLPSAAPDAS
jgi:hypothetical protein